MGFWVNDFQCDIAKRVENQVLLGTFEIVYPELLV